MKKICLFLLSVLTLSSFALKAQVTSTPFPLQESSQDISITFNASEGNKGLLNFPVTGKMYCYTWAVFTDGTTKEVSSWSTMFNNDKLLMVAQGDNLWTLYIGDIRSFYGITSTKTVAKLGFLFRSADGKKEGRGENGSDIMLDVLDEGLQVLLQSSIVGELISTHNSDATFTAYTTEDASISITVNGETAAAGTGNKLEAHWQFSTPGVYEVTATATVNDNTATATHSYRYVQASAEMAYPGGGAPVMGPVKNADGSVTFCIAAPEKISGILVGAWNDYDIIDDHVMYYTDYEGCRYFWITVEGLDNTTRYGYYFIFDGSIKVSDPYARLVLDPWNDKYISTAVFPNLPPYPVDKIQEVPLAIYQGNINDYEWQCNDFVGADPEDLIVYELLFRDFTGTENAHAGNGTVNKAIEKLDYLKTLGINAIELLPIMDFSGNISWGYNPNFYFAPDKAYGTPDDYKRFIDLCHQNGIAVILDMVFNQSDGLHPWYQMYTPGQNPFYNLNAPHAYSVLNDWNQGNPVVQQQFRDILKYWMEEYRFDGFRFDLVKGLGDNDSYSNNGDAATNAYNQSRVDRMISLHEFVKTINPNAYFINENLAGAKEENAMAENGQLNWANVNDPACQFAMGYKSNSNMNRLYAPKDGSRLWGSTVSYLESHDEQRLGYKQTKWGVAGVQGNTEVSMQRLGSAAAQMLMAPGAHMIWQFSEMGNAQNTKSDDGGNNTDPKTVNWNLLNDPYHKGLYDNYCELIGIRNNYKEIFRENVSFTMNCSATNWENGRTMLSVSGDFELYTVINPNIDGVLEVTIPFKNPSNDNYEILSKSYQSAPTFSAADKVVYIPANCYVVIGSKNLDSINDVQLSETDKALNAYGIQGQIVVASTDSPVSVFTADGRLVARTAESGNISVPAGLYILRNATASSKVLVK